MGFETPFHRHLNVSNRWVVLLSAKMLWDELVNVYQKHEQQQDRCGWY